MPVYESSIDRQIARQLDRAKDALARECRDRNDARERMLNLAVGEAVAIAWQTGFPHLVFPALADEKIDAVNRWARKQDRIRRQGLRASLAA